MASARQSPPRPSRAAQAPSRQSKAYHRRQEEAREERTRRRITVAAVAVLLIAGIVAVAGYLVTDYLPRHARIVTIGHQRYEAETVAKLSAFYMTSSGAELSQLVQRDPIAHTLDEIVRQETLLQVGASQVDPVSEADLEDAIRKRIGLAADAPMPIYDTSYTKFLKTLSVAKVEFVRSMRATVIGERLMAKHAAALPDEGVQLHLQAAQSPDKEKVQQVLDAIAGGTNFVEAAMKAGLAEKPEDVDFGWKPLDALPKVKDVLAPLQVGQNSGVVQLASGDWVAFRVVERDDRHPYEGEVGTPRTPGYRPSQKEQIARAQVSTWIDAQREALPAQRDLTPAREAWVLRKTRLAVNDFAVRANKASKP